MARTTWVFNKRFSGSMNNILQGSELEYVRETVVVNAVIRGQKGTREQLRVKQQLLESCKGMRLVISQAPTSLGFAFTGAARKGPNSASIAG